MENLYLELGKVYVTESGRKVKFSRIDEFSTHPFVGDLYDTPPNEISRCYYNSDGYIFKDTCLTFNNVEPHVNDLRIVAEAN